MTLQGVTLLGLILILSGHTTALFSAQNVCRTYGSGVFSSFNQSLFHLRSSCPVTLTHFSHAGAEAHIVIQRGARGLMERVEIIVNKITTLVHNSTLTVDGISVSLPYDHTYQHVFNYGIYTRLQSKVLPLSVTWYSVPSGVSSVWVQMDQGLFEGMTGLCGHQNSSETMQQLISSSVFSDGQCLTQDTTTPQSISNVCRDVLSHAYECLGTKYKTFLDLCSKNFNGPWHQEANCSFFREVSNLCASSSTFRTLWRSKSKCAPPVCPGDLHFVEVGSAFPPTCSNPKNSSTELTSTCLPPGGMVLNDRDGGYKSITVDKCPCVHAKMTYAPGQQRKTKCQSCTCVKTKWICSANTCPAQCIIEGQFITTFDGKHFSLMDRCTYVAARGQNWTLNIQYSTHSVSIEKVYLNIDQEKYTFSANSAQLNNIEISDLSHTESTTIFWQSSMFVQVQTSFGLKMQVQVFPEVQIYLNLPPSEETKGLCGVFNNDTNDDFTTFSGIIESSVQLFALSWSMGTCSTITGCISTDNEMFAEQKCDQLMDPEGLFAACHDYVPVLSYVEACVKRTCQCAGTLQDCLCVSFGNYAKACAAQGITIADWRTETNCIPSCMGNLKFSYSALACNHTCRSLSGPGPFCEVQDEPVEGCGCPSGTHLSFQGTCIPRTLCSCYHPAGITPPGQVLIGGRMCLCENAILHCPEVCNCATGKICVDCSQIPMNTAHRTCEGLTKPASDQVSCTSGCYCPDGLFEDHNGACVTREHCTCEYSGRVYGTGQSVVSNCKTCTCRGGEWSCVDEACSGVCEVYGNGQYRTFDSKWYRFNGNCQYTLVKDSSWNAQFSVKTESVPCCDESLTCSRKILVELLGGVALTLTDMRVIEKVPAGNASLTEPLYSIHTVGLYFIISIPRLGITIIWDKHTRVSIQLDHRWRGNTLGLCGNFDGKVMNDLLTSSSSEVYSVLDFGNSWKTATPPCSDVITEIYPCERHSYCATWAQRRCKILTSDTFEDCHLKVDPQPYYQACVMESCSCEYEGKFLGFCTAVAAYAEACSANDVCVDWRTPDLCPVYCDYFNEEGEFTWHYNPCGQIKTCGTNHRFTGKLEGCYPKCPDETPYYDENLGKCTTLDNCTCNFNNKVLTPSTEICSSYTCCKCQSGNITCSDMSTTTTTTTPYYTTHMSTTHITTTQQPTTEITTKYTTPELTTNVSTDSTTQGSTTPPIITELTSTIHRSTEPTAKYTTQHLTTETFTTSLETEKTQPTSHFTTKTQEPTTILTTEYTTHERTTTSYTTLVDETTTKQTEKSTTTPPITLLTTEGTTDYTNKTDEPSTPLTSQGTTTTHQSTTKFTTEGTTTTEETTTQPMTSKTSTEGTPDNTYITDEPSTPLTSQGTTTTHQSTTKFTPEGTTTTEETTTQPMTSKTSTEGTTDNTYITDEPSTPLTSQETTTTHQSTTKFTTEGTTKTEETTTQPMTSKTSTEGTTDYTNKTDEPSTPLTSQGTTTTHQSTTKFTTEGTTTTAETTTQPMTSKKHTTLSTTESTAVIVTGPTQSTPPAISQEMNTTTPTPINTTSSSTPISTVSSTTLLTAEPTTTVCECKDVMQNKSWPCGETWRENCADKSCTGGVIEMKSIPCPIPQTPDCPRNMMTLVRDEETCCESWKCDCQCEVYGDPHYISFQGATFDFMENCTYVLVEEQVAEHRFSIVLDNYYCIPEIDSSCARGIILSYWSDRVRLMVTEEYMVEASLNGQTIKPPYEDQTFRFESSSNDVSVFIKPIRSYVSLSPFNSLLISLGKEHFENNTQGQCGVCGGPSCIRRNGITEEEYCCDKTAYDWIVEDSLKPYCQFAPTNVPCVSPPPTNTPTTEPPPGPPCNTTICDLLYHEVFAECAERVDLTLVNKNCELDVCWFNGSVGACSALEFAASLCRRAGICVDWRSLSNGYCEITCPDGMVYDECHESSNTVCRDGAQVAVSAGTGMRSGCFCPDGQMLAEEHKQICVSECTRCKGPLGELMPVGAVWESNCHICTCNNQTKTEECSPKPPAPIPICSAFSMLGSDCCGNQICVEKSCEYNGQSYKVGDRWTDPSRPCEYFSCSETGTEVEKTVCPAQQCAENLKVWDEHHCCFSCNLSCAVRLNRMNLSISSCSQEVDLPVCEGHCEGHNRWIHTNGTLELKQTRDCCKESSYEMREITLSCGQSFTYKHVTGCQCKKENYVS